MELSACYDYFLICHSMRHHKHSLYRASLTTLLRLRYSYISPVTHVSDRVKGPIRPSRFLTGIYHTISCFSKFNLKLSLWGRRLSYRSSPPSLKFSLELLRSGGLPASSVHFHLHCQKPQIVCVDKLHTFWATQEYLVWHRVQKIHR